MQIFTTIPESLLIKVCNLFSVKEIWDAVCSKHESKALMVKVDICRCMYEMKCEDETNVCTHLEPLRQMQEQLVAMSAGLSNEDFTRVILESMPKSYRPIISTMSLSATHAKVDLMPDTAIQSLLDKFDQLKIKDHQLKTSENALTTTRG